jgi:hypothetical protein
MIRRSFRFLAAASIAILAFAVAARSAAAREVEFDADCRPRLTPLEQRLLDKAGAGIGTLRQYLSSRRAIYELPIYETAVWAERIGQRRIQCLNAHAQPLLAGAQTVSAPAADARGR